MRCFTVSGAGSLVAGIAVRSDEKLGQIVFLGEEGRGRRYEKVALGRRNPAEVVEGRVLSAKPVKITLPAKDGKPEKVFYILERATEPTAEVLVRVHTLTSYIRNGQGCWRASVGKPEKIIGGYGAFGDAGRIGNWDDDLVVVHPGDVLRVYPSRGEHSHALYLDAEGSPKTCTWQDWENLQAVAKAEAIVAEVEAKPEALKTLTGRVPCYSWSCGNLSRGIVTHVDTTGRAVALGSDGRGRKLAKMPLVGFKGELPEKLDEAAIAVLSEETIPGRYSWEQATTKRVVGFVPGNEQVADTAIVRVNTTWAYTKGTHGSVEIIRGNPEEVLSGLTAGGIAGRTNSAEDGLWIMRDGDILLVKPEGGYKTEDFALVMESGVVRTQEWFAFRLEAAKRDPQFWAEKFNFALVGAIPQSFIGKVVKAYKLGKDEGRGAGSGNALAEELCEGELESIQPLVINLGWDGKERTPTTPCWAQWVRIQTDKKVTRPSSEELEKRAALRQKAEALCERAKSIVAEGLLSAVGDNSLTYSIERVAEGDNFSTMPTEGFSSLTSWVANAEGRFAELAKFDEAIAKAQAEKNDLAARKAAYENAIWPYGQEKLVVWIAEDGSAGINCGKFSKMGRVEVVPSVGDGQKVSGPSLDDEGRLCAYLLAPIGVAVTYRDYTGSGRISQEVSLVIPAGLAAGLWALGEDEKGQVLYPFVAYGATTFPKVEVVRLQRAAPAPVRQEREQARTVASSRGTEADDRWAALRGLKLDK